MGYKHIIFDFDGVLVESNDIRVDGFRVLFKGYSGDLVSEMIDYVKLNGGKSRYEKIEYFFKEILKESISTNEVKALALQYSKLVKQRVINAPSVKGSLEFLQRYSSSYDFAIVSGSDQEELKEICKDRGIDHYFIEIMGSPASKEINIAALLTKRGWKKEFCLFVGDCINDLDATRATGIDFVCRLSGTMDPSLANNSFINDITQLSAYLGRGDL